MIKYLSPCSTHRIDGSEQGIYFFDDYGKMGQNIGMWTVLPKWGYHKIVHSMMNKLKEPKK